MADCKEAELISGYIDNELSGRERSSLELHLNGCRACREELRDLREMKELMSAAPLMRAPADLTESLLAEAAAVRRASEEKRRMRFPVWAAGLAAAASFVVWVGVRQPTPQQPISLDHLVSAHHRPSGGSIHDRLHDGSVYSNGAKGASDARV